jgi:hypothetical protein
MKAGTKKPQCTHQQFLRLYQWLAANKPLIEKHPRKHNLLKDAEDALGFNVPKSALENALKETGMWYFDRIGLSVRKNTKGPSIAKQELAAILLRIHQILAKELDVELLIPDQIGLLQAIKDFTP